MFKELKNFIEASTNLVFFTGAGISTESGIPDFRGPSGFWKTNKPIYFQDFVESEDMRRKSWERNAATRKKITNVKPNIGHLAIAEIMSKKPHSHLITQNVDNLHQEAGVPEKKITELHGNSTYARCLDCGIRYDLEPIHKTLIEKGELPHCEECGGLVKTATISFGQPMPEEEMSIAQRKTVGCDLFITIGTSLVVFPAAGFPKLAKEIGAKLIIINNEATDFDSIADLVIHDQIGKVFSNLSIR